MIISLIISVIVLSLTVAALLLYFYFSHKKNNIVDPNSPEILNLKNENDKLVDKINLTEKYLVDLKKDKEQLALDRKNVDDFKDQSNLILNEHKNQHSIFKNFHEKLVGDAKYQGRFNEKKLRNLLEKNGLSEEDGDFSERKGHNLTDLETGNKKTVNPDFIINIKGPVADHIVVDCKVSLKSFQDFTNAKDEASRELHLKKHIESVKTHIEQLSNKDYLKIHNLNSFQYVVLFLPFDSCYLSILEKSDDILDLCFEKNIMLAGPISIMSLISTITSIKNQEKQISQIDTIIGKAEDIFNKYNTLKKSLKTLISSHNTHAKSLTEVVHTSYGSGQGLESKIIKLKDDHGLDVNQLVKTDDKDKMVNFVEDPEDINKPN